MCPVSLSVQERFYYSVKQKSLSATNAQPHFPRPAPRCTQHILLTQIPPSQQWAPHLSSHQLIPTAPQGLRPGQDKLTSKVVKGMIHKTVDKYWGRSRMRRTRAAVVITRGRQGSLDWCPDPEKQQCAADMFGVTTEKCELRKVHTILSFI